MMKRQYITPLMSVIMLQATTAIMAGSATGSSVSDTEVGGVSGFSRDGDFFDDDDE